MNTQIINIEAINLSWSDWYLWKVLNISLRGQKGLNPPDKPGVYEARIKGSGDDRLPIGKAANLRMRVKQGLVKGKTPHSSGKKIRANENTSEIEIRWAETDRGSAAEEELHRLYKASHGGELPKYTKNT